MDTTWQSRLQAIPRLHMAEYPTPLEPLPRLGQELGRQVWVKRDDLLGPGLGGNKTRKLEYLLAEAQERKARKVVTFGGLQSNHARLTAAAANRLGLETHLFYFDPRPQRLTGNLLINHLLGAKMHFIPLGGGGSGMTLETTIRLVRWVALLMVGKHYFIPVGGHHWLGCLGYVQAALEIDAQAREKGIEQATLITAAGSGGTLAGLMAGLALVNSPLKLLGIDVGKLWKGFPASIALLAGEICSHLGRPRSFTPEEVPLIENTYVGERYGLPSPDGLAAMHLLAHTEGLLLDPVYTAKAFAGLLDLVRRDRIKKDTPLIFLHTGGVPALFAFQKGELLHD
ncbi:MAG: D-cysteine desulfhydrase family protein [Anaerolineales bacterium]|nr:D-cysteine desulfhydrase family protein [Anaerolineales bacterium]